MFDAFDDDQIDAIAEVDVSSMSRPTKRARTAPQDANTDSSSSSSSSSSTTSNSSTTASVSSTLTTKLATDTDYTDSTTDSTLATTTTRKPLPIIVVLDDGTTEREDGKASNTKWHSHLVWHMNNLKHNAKLDVLMYHPHQVSNSSEESVHRVYGKHCS